MRNGLTHQKYRKAENKVLSPSNPPARTPPQIGEHNLRVILEAIRRDGPLTRAELALRSGLTSAGITNILRNLREDGVVSSRRRATTGGGPPVTEFALVPDSAYGVGVAIYGHYGEAVLLSLGGAVSQRRRFVVETDSTETVIRTIRELDPTGTKRVLGVGIGAAQPETLSIEALRAALPHLSVSIERDCVAALYTERVLGVGAVDTGMMLIVIGDGIRAGYMFRGKPFSGVHNRAGSIGSMLTGPDRVPLDSVASLEKLRAVLSEEQRNELHAEGSLDFTPEVLEWIRIAAGHLLDAITASAGFLAPGAVLVGGDLPADLIDELIRQMQTERSNTMIRPVISPWMSPIRRTSFQGGGVAVGAALMPFFDVLLPPPGIPV